MPRRRGPSVLPVAPPSRLLGVAAAVVVVATTTALVFPLRTVAPVVSLGVVYLVAVLVISTVWGAWLGVLTALASALAFNYFHIPPTGRFTIAESENWVALVVFLIVALIGSSVAQVARTRATEADQRRREADLAAEMARLLLRGSELTESLPAAAQRLASALSLPSAAIDLAPVEGDERRLAFPLREGTTQLGTLLVPAGLPEDALRRLQERVVPSLEAVLAAGLERDRLLGEVVETRALRRADVVKTTLLRAVSHDLRTPLTAIVAAGEAIASPTLSDDERRELGSVITAESTRLSRLIDNLLDLSRLEGGAADPRPQWCSIEEVINAAVDDLRLPAARFSLSLDPDLPLVRADAAQLERAFANLLENGARYSGGHPVSVRARVTGGRLLVRVVDRGPGIPPAQRDRVFEPFYRAGSASAGHRGSGLGLAIVRGFVEANGGKVWVESLPGQGTSFVVELPAELLAADAPETDAAASRSPS
jgi:two-component system, OmpR family, sensor histidine kinase KdpD